MTETRALQRGEVLLRWLVPEKAQYLTNVWQLLLSADECARADRFHFAADRSAYVAAHALLRCLLGAQGIPAPCFDIGPWGRPELAGVPRRLRFSLTHTRTLVAVALALTDDLGVDTETADRETDALDLASRFFAPAEAARLAALPQAAREQEFLRIWTLKEAFVKAVGLGLSLPLDRFAFGAAPGEFSCAAELGDPASWSFRSLYTGPSRRERESWISIALRRPYLNLDAAPLTPAGLEWLAARHLPLPA